MFSLIDIVDMHRKQKHKSLYERCDVSTCVTEQTFREKHGSVPAEQCDFSEAYNGIISRKGEEIKTYVIGTTLWVFEEGYYLNTASSVNLLLMMYILSKHCGGRYEDITVVGYWDRKYGDIILMPTSEISEVTLDSVTYNYIGYAKGNGSWETAEGTNNSILYEAVAYFKHSPKYRDVLSNFKYVEAFDYYKYSGDPLSGASIVKNVLRNGGRFFMIKHSGFYGFFTQNKSMEISICFGGMTRKIPRVKSIDYLMKNFDAMVSGYLKAMLPFRKAQEQISSEVQALGLSGRIHGCIVDVDYYHHIMLNPLDGSITYYYSPEFGTVQPYKTFAKLLEHIDADYLIGEQDVREKYALMVTSGCLLSKESFSTSAEVGEMVTIEIKNSIYGLSARINQLQRLFTSRVLRDWNPALIDKQNREQDLIEDGSRKRGALK